MKKLTYLIVLSGIFSFTACKAQKLNNTESHKYVVLTKKIPQLKPILLTAEDLQKEDRNNFGDFQVIICGKTVTELTDREKLETFIKKAKELNVTINACGFSLKKFGVDETQLPKDIKVVKNGILYDLQLQKKGYYSLGL